MADPQDAIVAAYGDSQRRAAMRTSLAVERLWKQLAATDLSASWLHGIGDAVIRAVAAGQLAAALPGQQYVDAMVAADRLEPAYEPDASHVAARAFSGVAADGRPLDSLLYLPVIRTKTLIKGGLTLQQAMAGGWANMQRIVNSEVMDAGRGSAGVSMTANRTVTGFIRTIRPGACSRCAILAGRFYRYDADFDRHKHCFPAGVIVSGPQTLAATRRRYEGELVILTTASGQQLPATGNHPILTRRGWVPANLVKEGDEVVRSLRPQGASPLVVPDHQQVPARIEDVWGAHSMAGVLRGVPTTAEDFHGDGGHGEVDVVGPNRFLWGEFDPAPLEEFSEELFALGAVGVPGVGLAPQSHEFEGLALGVAAPDGGMGGGGVLASLLGGHLGRAQGVGFGLGPQLDPGIVQMAPDHSAHDAVPEGDGLFALTSQVGGGYVGLGQIDGLRSRWDAASPAGSVEHAARNARVGHDLLERLAGQVELDRVVEARSVSWSGHVYDLNSSEGWFSANGLIVSNCQCYGVPSTKSRPGRLTDPMKFFHGLSRTEQNRRFTTGGAAAIREGADIYSVVNASRSVRTLDSYGQKVVTTLEGTSRRGAFYRQMLREAEQRTGQRFARSMTDVEQGMPRFRLKTPRLMPGEIYKLAESRDELIRLLRRFGYLN